MDQRPVDWGRTAIFREQRGVDIDASVRRKRQDRWGQNVPIGNYYNDLRVPGGEFVNHPWSTQRRRLQNGHMVLKGNGFDGRSGWLLSPATRAVWLGNYRNNLMRRRQQALQCGTSKSRRPHKQQTHASPLSR
jgi:hypothetical protein